MTWISVTEALPPKFGWYKVKIRGEEVKVKVPYITNGGGKLVWLLPDENSVTHWMPDEIYNTWNEKSVTVDVSLSNPFINIKTVYDNDGDITDIKAKWFLDKALDAYSSAPKPAPFITPPNHRHGISHN